ncbi:protein of unknown function [Taphrina deformans PYCC 5710]|uniref:Uncharacterized protein n=1 Tax=Taphrina deformans (strain PYCC 5710 / ATCC 11124 / CBS 356.35 / IMI 108563 / JCM 9778 / NBRC 8474) TaxID=1097556 RepID=R4X8T9_TAPDE|nr:protein of unknown function [Taphrina deformans PYCC 5710]|eukprot:CCG80522.1 protein of unknown function [Taphrina deformans PYCC 5710]
MRLEAKVSKLYPAVSAAEDFDAWEADLRGRLASKACSHYVYDDETGNRVDRSIKLLQAFRLLEDETFDKAEQLLGISQPKPFGKTSSGSEKEEDTQRTGVIVKSEAADQSVKKEAKEIAVLHVEHDMTAWSCIQKGLTGCINDQIKDMTSRKAYLAVKRMYRSVPSSQHPDLGRELFSMKMGRNLSPASVRAFLEKRQALVSKMQSIYPDRTEYSWERQRKELADGLPEIFADVRWSHLADFENKAKVTYFSLCDDIRAVRMPRARKSQIRSRKTIQL